MFGYIQICKPELRVREYETYKAIYCSLCRRLGKSYGFLSRLTLSYDFTFLALLQMGLSDQNVCFVQKRCPFNPAKKCNFCKEDQPLEFSASAAMILLYYKICDNIADEHGLKKVGWYLLKPVFAPAHKKAAKKYPAVETLTAEYISRQSALEKENCRSIDRAADPSAQMLSALLTQIARNDGEKRILARLGYCLGRFIYLMDAIGDFTEDIQKRRYNVLQDAYTDEKSALERIEPQLFFCINEATKAFELLDLKKYKPILGNILYAGLEDRILILKHEERKV